MIPAVYVGEKKIAGRRELSAPRSWLLQLEYYFGAMKLPSITVGEIKKFEIWLSKIPARSTIVEDDDGKLVLNIKENGGQRGIESINRPVELLRTVLNYAVEEKMLREEQNPFSKKKARSLIDRPAETKREEFPTFGEELALLDACMGDRAHLRAVLIIAADSGLRRNELFNPRSDSFTPLTMYGGFTKRADRFLALRGMFPIIGAPTHPGVYFI